MTSTASTLTVATVPEYIAGRPELAGLIASNKMSVTEVGDGNLNQVFICHGADGRKLVLKQALPYVRLVGPAWPMTEQRAAREAAAIRAHSAVSDAVCRLIDFDDQRHVLVLEDLTDHTVLRTHLNAGRDHTGVAEVVGSYVADVAFGTSFLTLGEEKFRLRAAESVNSELCALTEDVIFTEPFLGAERNSVQPSVQPTVDALQRDVDWVAAAMAMKLRFLTAAEALLHGDLHTGSIFVRLGEPASEPLSVKAFDSEFAFYGPVGFDLGLLWANLLAAGVRACVLGEHDRGHSLFAAVQNSWDAFADRLWQLWPSRRSPEKYPNAFLRQWLDAIGVDAFGFAGCEAARRIVGLAKISDVEALTGEQHQRAATAILQLSRLTLVSRASLSFPELVDAATALADGDRDQ
ncbi:MAG: S-methyl-5-thioribose kinase [Actinomycetota bacterium]|nr:S-methyl-5-thioribose kinase [Actinomycetota bacterium]